MRKHKKSSAPNEGAEEGLKEGSRQGFDFQFIAIPNSLYIAPRFTTLIT